VIERLAAVAAKYDSVKKMDDSLKKIISGETKPKNDTELNAAKDKEAKVAKFMDAAGALKQLAIDLVNADGPPTQSQRQLYEEAKKTLQVPIP
jgi:hypothetical protein